ncbi:UDP-glucose 4-epimerase GalE [Solirhodobacter olei]|uniref:UDP-glucose 4-epimerase GalE n=1 Tax=Solirhodobacter olei TaxID=2493082 RepID=UPI000FD8FC42|nr:UDP-glucose 4-epimerase GalE [Solirhodobacter olei]
MRILVTGGVGYIGSHTVLQLLRADHEILVFDNYSNSSPEAMRRIKHLSQREPEMIIGDIQDSVALSNAFRYFRPDAVIHFAGLKSVGESSIVPLRYYAENIGGTVEILRAMDDVQCRRIVFSSSATVYGVARYLPFDEGHPRNPESPYGRTKYFVEELIKDWTVAGLDRSAVLLRYFNPVGADASAILGEDPNGPPNNLMPYITQVAVGRLACLSIFGDNYETRDGTGERDYIHVEDLASAHLAALEFGACHVGCEAINIGTGHGVTVLEMIEAFEAASGRKIRFKIVGRRDGDVARSFASVEKAYKKLGWKARYGIYEMCRSAWNWQLRNPDGYRQL